MKEQPHNIPRRLKHTFIVVRSPAITPSISRITIWLVAIFVAGTISMRAQGSWIWMHGSNLNNPVANYGTQFIAAPSNDPPGMYKPFSWTDANGKFWTFGGFNSINFNLYSDLWTFDPLTNMWTWVGGTASFNSPGIYGTMGVPSPTNRPGARYRGASWTDNSGNLWMFGGSGFDINGTFGALSDLWKFDPVAGNWTWVKGPTTVNTGGSYGTLGIAAVSNNPLPEQDCMAAWKSANGDLWFFGGQGSTGFYNHMWRYNIATNMWTWMSGSNLPNIGGNYGTLQVAAASNTPGSRCTFAHWTDSQGMFYLFAGHVVNSTFNDVWKYDPTTNLWTWIGGDNGTNAPGNYGASCVVNNFYPSTRTESLCTWLDTCNRLWFVGGNNSTILNAANSDVWFFDLSTGQFSLVGGSAATNTVGNYGTMTVASPTNYPPSSCGSIGWTDTNGDFWLFGGLLNPAGDNMNAMWKYTRPLMCPSYIFTITPNPTAACVNSPIAFSVSPTSSTFEYAWNFGDPSTLADTSHFTTPSYTYTTAGTYTISLIVHNTASCNQFTDTITTTISITPFPAFTLGNDTTICGPFNLQLDAQITNANYSWSTGDTTQTINTSSTGTYAVTVSQNGCSGTDSIIIVNHLPPSLGADTSYCSGQSLTLDAGVWNSYLWNDGSTNQTLIASGTNSYWVQVTSAPCVFSDTINISINPIPVVNLGPDTTLCPGSIYTLDAGNAGSTFAWSTSETTQTINVDHQDYYNVVVTLNNCSGIGNVTVNYYPQLDLGPDLQLCNVSSLSITAGAPGYPYLWSTGDTSNTISVYNAGTYFVTVDNGTCVLSDTINATGVPGAGALFIPNAFTPNKNDLNDKFYTYGEGITSFHLMIFDRWGQLVFETNDMLEGWDGKVKDRKPYCDTYVYRVVYRTECSGDQDIERIGQVNLIH